MNIFRKTALALVNQAKYGRLSKKKMMFKAALILKFCLILFSEKVNAVAVLKSCIYRK